MSATSKFLGTCALALLLAAAVVAPFGLTTVLAAQRSDVAAIDWRNHTKAQAEVDRISVRLAEIQPELAALEAELAELGAQLSAQSLDEGQAIELLAAAQKIAREFAVQAYVSGTAANLDSYLLGTSDAAELTYMTFFLEEHAESLLEAGRNYMELRSNASAAAVELSNQLDAVRARQTESTAETVKLEAALPAAEHWLFIASVHADADAAFVRSGRPDPTQQQWEALRFCESTLNYRSATGNGFYGAYQFTIDTWYTVGGSSSPDVAGVEEQDARARLLYARRGSQPWPICGRYLP